jgi:peptidoglycan hydrolase-like protein with peptidoglycan-binding domain
MSRSTWASTNSHAPTGDAAGGAGQPGLQKRVHELWAAASSAKKCLKILLAAGLLALFAVPASAHAAAGKSATHHHVTRHRVVVLAYGAGYARPDGRVRSLQRQLARAVMRFQAAHHLIVDGIAGPLTLGMLRHPGIVLYPGTGNGTSQGSIQVRRLQQRLRQAGFSPGPIDGRYGPKTEHAVARFQRAHGLAVDGIAGPITVSQINHNQTTTTNNNQTHNNHNETNNNKHNRKPTSGQHARATKPSGHPAGRRVGSQGRHTGAGAKGTQARHTTAGPTAPPQPSGTPKPTRQAPGSAQHGSNPGTSSSKSPVSLWLIDLLVALVLLSGIAAVWLVRRRQRHAAQINPNRKQAADQRSAQPQRTVQGNGRELVERPDRTQQPVGTAHQQERSTPEPGIDPQRSDTGDRLVADRPSKSNGQTWVSGTRASLGDPDGQGAEQAPGVNVRVGAPDQPTDAHGMFGQGERLEQHGDVSGAIVAYGHADRLGHGPAAANLGLLLEQEGDLKAAGAAYTRADDRGDARGAFNLAVLTEEQGQLEEARIAYKRADDRGHAAAATNLGVFLEQQGDLRAAEACYRRADQRGDAPGAFNLAVLLEEKGDRLGALNAYRRASHRGNPQITELARAAMLDLKQQPQHRATAKKGGERNGH